jgi:hypothetical protein
MTKGVLLSLGTFSTLEEGYNGVARATGKPLL